MDTKYKLSDDAIAQLIRVLQLGLLTGTDVADNFRTMQFVARDATLEPDPEYAEQFEENLKKLQDGADELASQQNKIPGFRSVN